MTVKPTFIDQVIGAFSPRAGLRRLQARAGIAAVMNYDAASRGRRTSGWSAPMSSADGAASSGARAQVRALARDFVRNRPFAHRGLSVIVNNVVGRGVPFSIAQGDDAARAKALKSALDRHLGSRSLDAAGVHDIFGMQRVGLSAAVQDGEVLLRRRWRTGRYGKGLVLPFQVELLEADFLDETKRSHGKNKVVDGLEFGPTGAVVAYHFFTSHPGDMNWRASMLQSVRVPAEDVIHVRRVDRPGQMRGVSWFAPVLLTLGELSDYQEGELLKQKIAALMAAFIESEPEVGAPLTGASDDTADVLGLEKLAPGMIIDLPAGKKVSFSTPPAMPGQYDQFMRQNLSAVAMGLGITVESLTGDLSRVNFSAGRMGRLEMDRNIEAWQHDLVIGQISTGIMNWAREACALVPEIGSFVEPVSWTPPRRPVIDPAREIPALIHEIDAGLLSRHAAIRSLGRDPVAVDEERAADVNTPTIEQ